jgi:N-hydroxyarylamine O-acetyltransferase
MDLHAYLARIGYAGPIVPTVATLAGISWAHLRAVPFENLDIVPLRRPIRLEPDALFDKIVRRRRGGYCYELNGLLASILEQIGYRVTRVSAQWRGDDGTLSPVFDHLVLLVETTDSPDRWLVDVGAGRSSLARPLRLVTGEEQPVPETAAIYRLQSGADAWELHRQDQGAGWTHDYTFTLIPRRIEEFGERSIFQQTAPDSHFTQGPLCSLARPDGRITLSRDRLIVTAGGAREERILRDDRGIREALRTHFDIDLTHA